MCIQLKPLFSRHKGIGVQFTDEPTGNLDSKNRWDVFGLLKRASKEYEQTIVMITHDQELAMNTDKMYRIEDGEIVKGGIVFEKGKQGSVKENSQSEYRK